MTPAYARIEVVFLCASSVCSLSWREERQFCSCSSLGGGGYVGGWSDWEVNHGLLGWVDGDYIRVVFSL